MATPTEGIGCCWLCYRLYDWVGHSTAFCCAKCAAVAAGELAQLKQSSIRDGKRIKNLEGWLAQWEARTADPTNARAPQFVRTAGWR